jgi:adenylate kinase family enzyme
MQWFLYTHACIFLPLPICHNNHHAQVDRVVAVAMDSEALVRKGVGRRHCNECRKGFNVAHIDEVTQSSPPTHNWITTKHASPCIAAFSPSTVCLSFGRVPWACHFLTVRICCVCAQPGLYMPAVLPDAFCVAKGCLKRLTARDDDVEAVVRHRLAVFRADTLPALDFYRRIGAQRAKALQALAMVMATPTTAASSSSSSSGFSGSSRNQLVVDVAIIGGFSVMAPVFEAALGLEAARK